LNIDKLNNCITQLNNNNYENKITITYSNGAIFDIVTSSYTGRVYCNGTSSVSSGLPTNRYMSMTLDEDDEVTVIARCDAGALTFAYVTDITIQKDVVAITSDANTITEVKYVAKNGGVYRIYDATQKASFYRILRKAAVYVPLTGNLDVTQAPGIPAGYSILFTNPDGKSWNAPVVSGAYNVSLPAGYTYQMSLVNANGYIISNDESLAVTESTISSRYLYSKIGFVYREWSNYRIGNRYFKTKSSLYARRISQ
jgi:exo-poly-alpha-galacturonosidase